MRVFFIITLCFCWTRFSIADDRILFHAKINDHAVRLAFDTGAEYTTLFSRTAKRVNLKWTNPPANVKISPGKVPLGISEECRFVVGGTATQTRLRVFNPPAHLPLDVDGVLAWADVKQNILRIDPNTKMALALPSLPKDEGVWRKWNLRQNSRVLAIALPDAAEGGGTILIDTGSPTGVELSPSRWMDWCSKHKDRPLTLSASYTPSAGLKVYEKSWADKLALGQFTIGNVPVRQSSPGINLAVTDYEATLGLFALTRQDVIIDGKNSALYTRPISNPKKKYQYNRIAAVFVPKNMRSKHLVAHVVEGGPAYQAGIRSGDVLLKINDLNVTNWRTDPKVLPLSRFWERPAGTKLELSLQRDGNTFKVTVKLKEIFPQSILDNQVSAERSSGQPNAPADADKLRR